MPTPLYEPVDWPPAPSSEEGATLLIHNIDRSRASAVFFVGQCVVRTAGSSWDEPDASLHRAWTFDIDPQVFGRLKRRRHHAHAIRRLELMPGVLRHDCDHPGAQR